MYIVKNAIANLGRNKGRNILLGAMMFLILFTGTVSIMIHNATGNQIEAFQQQFAASVILYRDNNKITMETDYREPTLAELQKFATSTYLKHTELIASVPASISNGKALDEESTDLSGFDKEQLPQESTYKISTNMIFGTNTKTINGEFENGIRKIIDGKVFEQKDEAIISQKLAEKNNWKVGDKIKLQLPNFGQGKAQTITVTISGIYEDHNKAYENEDAKMALTNRGNEIITSLETLTSQNNEMISVVANFTIQDPKDIEKLEAEFHEKGLPEYFSLKTDDAAYQKAIAPLVGLQDVTKMLLLSVFVIGGAILVTLSILAIRERIYEVGVLRAMGMKKHALAFSFLCEGICMTGICLVLAFGAAKISSQPLAQVLFQNQSTEINTPQEGNEEASFGAIGGFNSGAGASIQEVEISITQEMMLEIMGMAVLFATISSIGGIYFVMRYEPRRILSERS